MVRYEIMRSDTFDCYSANTTMVCRKRDTYVYWAPCSNVVVGDVQSRATALQKGEE